MTQRKIIHIDMDAFYASVEQRDNPQLKGKPVAVGGTPERRGVIAAASYEAREYGVRSAMPSSQALARCPDLLLLPPRMDHYRAVSREIHSILREYTQLIEPLSLDESYLDVSHHATPATELAEEIRRRIKETLSLTASAGVAPNKFLAKIASDINKPDGIFVIKPHQVESFLQHCPVKKLWGVGNVTAQKLAEMNITTCGELTHLEKELLVSRFGRYGHQLYNFARGIDSRPVEPHRERKSVGSERTLQKDIHTLEECLAVLHQQSQRTSERLRAKDLTGIHLTLKVKYGDFTVVTRSHTMRAATADEEDIFRIASSLLTQKTDAGSRPIRLLGVSVSGLEKGTSENSDEEGLLFPF